jgi:hypothetical protein
MDKPLTDEEYLLERFSGKGGWTYVALPEIKKDKDMPFGLVKVKGTIDGYEIKNYSLMPFGNGTLILPVKAEIRKQIKKEEGDYVHVILYADTEPYQVPDELKNILQQTPGAYERYITHKRWEQKMCAEWIFSAKREETKAERIAKTLFRLQRREKIV